MTQVPKDINQEWEAKCNMILATCIEREKDILDSLYNMKRYKYNIEGACIRLEEYIQDIKILLDGTVSCISTLIGKTIRYKRVQPKEYADDSYKTIVCTDIGVTDNGLLYCLDEEGNRTPGDMHISMLYSLLRTGYLYMSVDGELIDFTVLY